VIAPRSGAAVLTAGTVTVSTPWAFPQSLIQLTNAGPGGTVGTPCVTAVATGSFTITSTSQDDTSTIAWQIT
jgi:hypothetical protein